MIIKSFEVNKIKNSTSNIFLIYGKNEGLKNKIIEQDILSKSESKLERLEESEIINNFECFRNKQTSFFDIHKSKHFDQGRQKRNF